MPARPGELLAIPGCFKRGVSKQLRRHDRRSSLRPRRRSQRRRRGPFHLRPQDGRGMPCTARQLFPSPRHIMLSELRSTLVGAIIPFAAAAYSQLHPMWAPADLHHHSVRNRCRAHRRSQPHPQSQRRPDAVADESAAALPHARRPRQNCGASDRLESVVATAALELASRSLTDPKTDLKK